MTTLALRGLDLALHPEVYRPAEDTELLLQALEAEPLAPDARACDVGTGTGALALALARRGARVLALDLQPAAARLARANAARNGLGARVGVVQGLLLEPLRGPFDLVAFNPPYLPVEGEVPGALARAWEGGAGGIAWAPGFLRGLRGALAPGGKALVVLSSLGDREGFLALARGMGFSAERVAAAKLPWEELEVARLRRANLEIPGGHRGLSAMASSEAPYTASESTLVTRPKVREEVREELREEVRTVEMNRIAPDEKLRIERDAVTLAAGDVEMAEKSWRKTQPETLAEIERRVDAMGSEAPAPPRPPARAAGEVPRPSPPLDLPPPGARKGRSPGGRLTPAEQRALARHLGGAVVRASVLFATSRGRVVEVEHKAAAGASPGGTRRAMVLLEEGGKVSTMDEIGRRLDEMSLKGPAPSPAAAEAAAEGLTRGSPSTRGQVIERIEGIGEAYGQQLRAEGVATVEDLVARDPAALAAATGISAELIRKWQAMGRLQAVRGIGPQYSEFLVRAGVGSLEALARETPESLAKRLLDHQKKLQVRIQGTTVSPALVEPWIRQARELTGAGPGPAAHARSTEAPAPSPAAPAPAPAREAPAPRERKKLGLSLGRKAGGAEAPAAEAPSEAKPKFGLKLGRKKDEPAGTPSGGAPEGAAGGEAEPAEEAGGEARDEAGGKKRFGLKLGRK